MVAGVGMAQILGPFAPNAAFFLGYRKYGLIGALLSVPILLMLTALFDHIGRPNLIGFVFGEPLFANNVFDSESDAPNPTLGEGTQ